MATTVGLIAGLGRFPLELARGARRRGHRVAAVALHELSEKNIVDLDEEKKATMVNNLMVVLTSEHSAAPVLNTGTLYG